MKMQTIAASALALGVAILVGMLPASAPAQRSTPVTVINTDANPVPVETGADRNTRTPFSTSVTSAFGNFRGIATADTVAGEDFTVPAGQILVIEHVSLRATIDNADQVGFMRVFFDADGVGGDDELVLGLRTDLASLPIGATRKLVTYDWPVTIYAAPESEVVMNLNSIAGSSTGAAEWVVSGYLVPATGSGLGR